MKLSKELELGLIAKARQGNQQAARELVEWHEQRLFAFVWRIVRNHAEAEDVCQEALMRAMTSLDDFDAKYRFSTWVFTIGYRLALNLIKQRSRQSNYDFSNLARADESSQVDEIIESEYASKVREVIWEEVDSLSATQKATILMFYREGLSCQEVSEALDMPVATVKSHMHRARAKLRERLRNQKVDGNSIASAG